MKRIWKKLLGIMLVLTMVLGILPIQAAAAKLYVPKTMEVTMYSANDTNFNGTKKNEVYIYDVPGKITNLKSSKPSVATVERKGDSQRSLIYLNLKKTGKTTVSFKYKSKAYKMTVTVQKYKNPVSYVKIGNTTLSRSKFNTMSTQTLKYSQYANKKQKVTIKLAKGWELGSGLRNGKEVKGFFYFQKGWLKSSPMLKNKSKVTVKGGKGYIISFNAVNKKTGQIETMALYFK